VALNGSARHPEEFYWRMIRSEVLSAHVCPSIRGAGEDQAVLNPLFAFALFLSSYAPAFVILAVRAYDRSCLLFWSAIVLLVVSVLAFVIFLSVAPRGAEFRAEVEEMEPRDADMAAYVATYLLPFLTVTGANSQDVIALALFLFFIGVLWVGSGMLYLNPLLRLARVHIYVVRVRPISDPSSPADTLPRSFLLIREPDLREGSEVLVRTMGKAVLTGLKRGS
jgi:hypothetical protein